MVPLKLPRVPLHFRCPISLELMGDPVTLSTGQTYDRSSIEKWFESGHSSCPATMQQVDTEHLVPNHTLRRLIQEWCVANRSRGVERIPTPKQPLDADQASRMLHKLSVSSDLRVLRGLRSAAKESEKNRKRLVASGAAKVVCRAVAASLSVDAGLEQLDFCEDAVATILLLLPLEPEADRRSLISPPLLRVLAWMLDRSSCEGKINSALLIQSLARDEAAAMQMGATPGLVPGLVKLLKEDLYQRAVKASLVALLSIVSCKRNGLEVVEAGAVPFLVELLPQASAHNTERALGVLEKLARCAEGRAQMVEHGLCVPMLVKIVLTVSDLASQRAVEILWVLCQANDRVASLAAQEGAFTQMLLLLQADNTLQTSQRVRELLKLLRPLVPHECLHNFTVTMPF